VAKPGSVQQAINLGWMETEGVPIQGMGRTGEVVFSAPQLVRAKLHREIETPKEDHNLGMQMLMDRPSQWQVLDERVIEKKDLASEYEVQYLPEIRTVLPPPQVEYVEVPVPVEVERLVPVETVVEVEAGKSADQVRLLKAQLARAYAGFEMHLRPLQARITELEEQLAGKETVTTVVERELPESTDERVLLLERKLAEAQQEVLPAILPALVFGLVVFFAW